MERVHEVNCLKCKIPQSESYRTVTCIFIKQVMVYATQGWNVMFHAMVNKRKDKSSSCPDY
jgi:hypothetical protein